MLIGAKRQDTEVAMTIDETIRIVADLQIDAMIEEAQIDETIEGAQIDETIEGTDIARKKDGEMKTAQETTDEIMIGEVEVHQEIKNRSMIVVEAVSSNEDSTIKKRTKETLSGENAMPSKSRKTNLRRRTNRTSVFPEN